MDIIDFHTLLSPLELPMFFLISGFVVYKNESVWNLNFILHFLKKKITVLLLSPLLFFAVYTHMRGVGFIDGFFNEPKYGYWFTFILFFYYVVYALVRFSVKGVLTDYVLLVIGFCFLPCSWPQLMNYIPIQNDYLLLLSFQHWHYFLYFVIGSLIKKYYDQFQNLLEGRWLLPICIVVFFLLNAFRDVLPMNKSIIGTFLTWNGLVIFFSFFRNYKDAFSQNNKMGRMMQFVGRNTLSIYLIHFFLLPWNLSFITLFVDHPMPVIELFVSSCFAILIIVVCLLINSVICLSPTLAYWLFGVKRV